MFAALNSYLMIIFGTRAGKVTPAEAQPFDCGHCHSKMSVRPVFIQRYFHVFWIPFFPLSKKGVTQCSHCKQVLYEKEVPAAMKPAFLDAKGKVKTPLKYFAGLILLGLLIVVIAAINAAG